MAYSVVRLRREAKRTAKLEDIFQARLNMNQDIFYYGVTVIRVSQAPWTLHEDFSDWSNCYLTGQGLFCVIFWIYRPIMYKDQLGWILKIFYSNITTQERENANGKMSLEKVADIYRIYEERRKKG